ncbi:MAG: hypothetical protein KGZ51_05825 [Erysipelothrix sp.]|jgi:predicted RNA-binding Zn-ribbon protein involved in translation (DUF1610 family)|nr:hypothetical protein [Erysipelothrix sp.]
MKKYLSALYREENNTRQQKVVGLLIGLFFLSIFTDITFNSILIPFRFIRIGLGFFVFTTLAIHIYKHLMTLENISTSARWIALIIAFVVVQWVGGFGMMSFNILYTGLFEIFALVYGALLVNQVITEETEKTTMKDQRYAPPVYRTTNQVNTDMTPKVHTTSKVEASTTGATSWYCPSCGEKILQKTKKCPHCKEKVEFFD